MNRKLLIVLSVFALVAVVGAVTDASAACSPAKAFFTLDSAGGPNYRYVNFPAGADDVVGGPALKGRHWQAGNRTLHNEGPVGACPEAAYLLPIAAGKIGVLGALGSNVIGADCDNFGCPPSSLVLVLQTTSTDGANSYYAAGRVDEVNTDFNFARASDWQMIATPRPRVTSSSRSGGTVTVNVSVDPPSGARGDTGYAPNAIVTGYQIVRFEGTGDPGRDAALWTNLGTPLAVDTGTGGSVGGVALTCGSTTNDVFVATRLVYDNGQFSGDYVSASTRVECDPALADPRFKMIDRSKSGRGTIRPN